MKPGQKARFFFGEPAHQKVSGGNEAVVRAGLKNGWNRRPACSGRRLADRKGGTPAPSSTVAIGLRRARPLPSGESPDGTGQWPVLPAPDFSDRLINLHSDSGPFVVFLLHRSGLNLVRGAPSEPARSTLKIARHLCAGLIHLLLRHVDRLADV